MVNCLFENLFLGWNLLKIFTLKLKKKGYIKYKTLSRLIIIEIINKQKTASSGSKKKKKCEVALSYLFYGNYVDT